MCCRSFFFNAPPATEIYTLSLHDALPIFTSEARDRSTITIAARSGGEELRGLVQHLRATAQLTAGLIRSEEHTSELQSRRDLVCRLLLEKKNTDDPDRVDCLQVEHRLAYT